MNRLIIAAIFGGAALALAPVALAHDRDDGARMERSERSGSSHADKADRADQDHGRNRGPEAHGRGRGGDENRAEDHGRHRRGRDGIEDADHNQVGQSDDKINGVKRRGDGSIDDNSVHTSSASPKGV